MEWLRLEGISGGHLVQPLPAQARLPRANCQDCVQMTFEYLQGWKLHNLLGQLVPMPSHPHSEKVFPDIHTAGTVFQFVSIASDSVLDTNENSLAPSSLHPPFRYLCTLIRLPRIFSSAG